MRVQYGRAAFDSVVVGRQPIAARPRGYTFWSSEVPPFALRVSFFWFVSVVNTKQRSPMQTAPYVASCPVITCRLNGLRAAVGRVAIDSRAAWPI